MEDAETVRGVAGTIWACEHLKAAPHDVESRVEFECEDCVRDGFTAWVHLRKCLACGHMACCDSSPRKHASAHFDGSGHPVMRSAEPGEEWRWCFVDNRLG
jgi:CPA1 family monovalent cation:H+ antiporter